MSASREKKTRQGQTSQGPDERVQERQRKQKADRRSSILYAVVGVICVAAIAVTLVLNSGLIQRSMTAVTTHFLNGTPPHTVGRRPPGPPLRWIGSWKRQSGVEATHLPFVQVLNGLTRPERGI